MPAVAIYYLLHIQTVEEDGLKTRPAGRRGRLRDDCNLRRYVTHLCRLRPPVRLVPDRIRSSALAVRMRIPKEVAVAESSTSWGPLRAQPGWLPEVTANPPGQIAALDWIFVKSAVSFVRSGSKNESEMLPLLHRHWISEADRGGLASIR